MGHQNKKKKKKIVVLHLFLNALISQFYLFSYSCLQVLLVSESRVSRVEKSVRHHQSTQITICGGAVSSSIQNNSIMYTDTHWVQPHEGFSGAAGRQTWYSCESLNPRYFPFQPLWFHHFERNREIDLFLIFLFEIK